VSRALEVIKKYSLSTKKRFGQNFLVDEFLLDKIVGVAENVFNKNVLEIGPGPGGLTEAILKNNPKKLVSIEIDKDLAKILEIEFSEYSNFFVKNGDALQVDERRYFDGKIIVIANLPYNIGTVLLMKWLKNLEIFSSFTLLLQKEVVERIAAYPSTKNYGRISVMVQALCSVKKEFDIKPNHFIPPPKVMSSVVKIIPKNNPATVDVGRLSKITFALFSQRRKKIKGTIEKLIESHVLDSLSLSILDLNKRPEEITVEEFIELSRHYFG